jgi:hypothetical protein
MLVRRASQLWHSILSGIVITAIACHESDNAAYTVQRIALDTLFNGREHARELVIWSSDSAGPVLESILSEQHRKQTRIDIHRLDPTIPANAIDEPALTLLFRDHPDGWAEFFRLFPRSSGLVELSPVRFSSGDSVAEVFVGRSCGEHCRNAWRIVARRGPVGAWRVAELRWIAVPGT